MLCLLRVIRQFQCEFGNKIAQTYLPANGMEHTYILLLGGFVNKLSPMFRGRSNRYLRDNLKFRTFYIDIYVTMRIYIHLNERLIVAHIIIGVQIQ